MARNSTFPLAGILDKDKLHESRNGNCGVVVTARRGARHSAAAAEPMCALQRLLCSEGIPARAGVPCGGFGVDFSSGKISLKRWQQ